LPSAKRKFTSEGSTFLWRFRIDRTSWFFGWFLDYGTITLKYFWIFIRIKANMNGAVAFMENIAHQLGRPLVFSE
jgi:hypothetical protein